MLKRAAGRLPLGLAQGLAGSAWRSAGASKSSLQSRNILSYAAWHQPAGGAVGGCGGSSIRSSSALAGRVPALAAVDARTAPAAWGARIFCSAAYPSAVQREDGLLDVPKPMAPHPVSHIKEEQRRRERIATFYFDHPVMNLGGEQVGTMPLATACFQQPLRKDLLQRVVLWQQFKKRADAIPVKNRSEVRGGGKKPWPQKGSGRARHGSIRSPLWKGGGKAMARKAKSWEYDMNKKVRRLALRVALSARMREGKLTIVEDLDIKTNKTAFMQQIIDKNGWDNALIIGTPLPETFKLACGNIGHVDVLPGIGANVYSILRRRNLIISKGGVEYLHKFLLRLPE
mmetsp:Transcript_34648/g.67904  ORF Transcript_34648/g.67904 Transcript_34648/m.67904 type:complete len:343 (-) Transcript_34648:111-1139(-)